MPQDTQRDILAKYGLSARQKTFADEYFISQNSLEAVSKAGYSASNPHAQAKGLIENKKVRLYLDSKAQELFKGREESLAQRKLSTSLNKREEAELETLKHFNAIDDAKSPTKYKYWELILKLKGHLKENDTPNLFGQLKIGDILSRAKEITTRIAMIEISTSDNTHLVNKPKDTSHDIPTTYEIKPD